MDRLKRILGNHWTVIGSLAVGVLVGLHAPRAAAAIKPLGDIYFRLIVLCCTVMLPVIIAVSIGKIVVARESRALLARIFAGLILTFAGMAALGMGVAFLAAPLTAPTPATERALGSLLVHAPDGVPEAERDALKGYAFIRELDAEQAPARRQTGFVNTLTEFVPESPFEALANRRTVQVMVFAVIFGLLFGVMAPAVSESLIRVGENVFEAFNTMLTALIYALPFGIVALIANQTAGLNFRVFLPLLKLAELLALLFLVLFAVCLLVIRLTSRRPTLRILRALQEPLILSFVAENLVAMPSLVRAMTESLGYHRARTRSAAPLWMGLEIHADIAVFAAAAMFTLQLYEVPLGAAELALVLVGAVLAGLSSLAAAAVLWVALIRTVLDPLGIPSAPIILALMLFEPFFNGLLFLLNAMVSCAAVALVAGRQPDRTGARSGAAAGGPGPGKDAA